MSGSVIVKSSDDTSFDTMDTKPTPDLEYIPEPASESYVLDESAFEVNTIPDGTTTCGVGTILSDGICVAESVVPSSDNGGGCLIATATYGTEMAPQVQLLREIRDNTLMSTGVGESFMESFNDVYYSFSPSISDAQRENPLFQELVRIGITPLITSLSIMSMADSETDVLFLGIITIALNLGMYVGVPALVGFRVHKYAKSRNS